MTQPGSTDSRLLRATIRAHWLRPAVLGAVCMVLLSACGLPGSGSASSVDDASVPYHLLAPETTSPGQSRADEPVDSSPLVFWLRDGDILVPEAIDASCSEQPEALAEQVLDELATGPSDEARADGRATALPPESGLNLVGIQDGTAQVELNPQPEISADRLPVAIGQIVLSLASTTAVGSVAFTSNEEPVPVPLPGGALTSAPVTPADYDSLRAGRHRDSTTPGSASTPGLGCPLS
jgi:hypothetical protein